MGFYFAHERVRELTDDFSPTITAGEYVSAFVTATRTFAAPPPVACYRYRQGLLHLMEALPERAARVLSDLIRRHPNHQPTHRLLAVAYLRQGNFEGGLKHLEIALGLLEREAAVRESLYQILLFQCERALLRWMLMALYLKVGRTDAARRLVIDDPAL